MKYYGNALTLCIFNGIFSPAFSIGRYKGMERIAIIYYLSITLVVGLSEFVFWGFRRWQYGKENFGG